MISEQYHHYLKIDTSWWWSACRIMPTGKNAVFPGTHSKILFTISSCYVLWQNVPLFLIWWDTKSWNPVREVYLKSPSFYIPTFHPEIGAFIINTLTTKCTLSIAVLTNQIPVCPSFPRIPSISYKNSQLSIQLINKVNCSVIPSCKLISQMTSDLVS